MQESGDRSQESREKRNKRYPAKAQRRKGKQKECMNLDPRLRGDRGKRFKM